MVETFTIQTPRGPRTIGPGHPVFVIGEMSGNHNGSLERARELVDAAVAAGVDAIKLQTYTPDTLTIDCDKDEFQVKVNDAWRGKTLYELYGEAYTPWDWQPELKRYAEGKGVLVFSSPFDATSVDFLEAMDVALYKVASFEIVDIPLLERIAATKKPVIMSRGMASVEDIELAIATLRAGGCPQVALLHCVSSYPAVPEQMNLTTIPDLAARFGVVAGLSDHTLGTTVPVASVALGACIIEKHYTLRRADGGPDAAFSLEPEELAELVEAVRVVEKALGKPSYQLGKRESENVVFRKSVFVVEDVKAGELLTEHNVRVIRPGQGLAPKYYRAVLGQRATRDIERGTPMRWDLVEHAPAEATRGQLLQEA